MFIILYLSILLPYMVSSKYEPFHDFVIYDYCELNCTKNGVKYAHPACGCALTPPREEITYNPDQITFRQKMVDKHNEWRNEVALGKGIIGPAADMMVVNYDRELEYIARCYGTTYYTHVKNTETGQAKCSVRHGNLSIGQNLAGSSNKTATDFEIEWYKKDMEFIKSYEHVPASFTTEDVGMLAPRKFDHLTQVLYWAANRIGCWRVWNPDNIESWRHTLLCYYGSTIYEYEESVKYHSIFQRGEHCSQCPKGTKCNTKYKGLCGELLSVPKSNPPALRKGFFENKVDVNAYKAHNIVLMMTVTFVFLMQN